ncbi:MAG: response regulator, partial [Nitrospirota bacterium]
MRVLLIEDNEDDACLIGELLTERIAADIELQWSDRLESGLTRVTEGNIDVVLLSLSLPDSHGLETLDKIQALLPDMPIIVLTHQDDEVMAVQAVRKGAQDYLVKGRSDGLLLVRAIRYAIERKQSEKAVRDSETRLRTIINTAHDA